MKGKDRIYAEGRIPAWRVAAGLVLSALAGLALLVARAQAAPPGPTSPTTDPPAAVLWEIDLTDNGFVPASVRAQPGDRVRWTNRTASPQVLRSGLPRLLYLPLILRPAWNAAAGAGAPALPLALDADGAFPVTLQPGAQFTHTFTLTGTFPFYAGPSPHWRGQVVVAAGSPLPPDPADVAQPLAQNVATGLRDAVAFLYTGPRPIQTGVVSGTIELRRAAVLRGRVLGRDGAALPGAVVRVLDRPELGQTLSRADGLFDLAVNGGGWLTVHYAATGYLPAQRQVSAAWQEFAWLPDVALTPLDPRVTVIDLTSAQPVQTARGSVISDTRGLRQETLLFPAGLRAVMTLPGGVTQTLTALSVRATEFSAGEDGPQAMPAALPPNSAYTYAAEFSVDEATTAGALDVAFSPPALSYNENFLGFPVGTPIPMGYYDRQRGVWVAAESGRVVGILGVAGGLALLDVDGSGQPADPAALAALGVSDAERAALAELYAPGQSLWRVPVGHFSPWDKNMGVGCEEPCDPPNLPPPQPAAVANPDCQPGSIIECQNQALAEEVALTGAPFRLRYQSDRAAGRRADYTLRIPLSGPALLPTLRAIHLEIAVAGRRYSEVFDPPSPNLTHTFAWDGRDAYGRALQGQHPVTVRIGYGYRLAYAATERFGYNGNGVPISVTAQEFILWQVWRGYIGGWDALPQGLGGWSLSVHHAYDPAGRVFYGGDGRRRNAQPRDLIIHTVAGPGGLDWPTGVSAGPDGSLYIADGSGSSRIWRLWPDGSLTPFAGAGGRGFAGDGGPATQALFSEPQGIALAPDGSLYVADTVNHRIRKIDPNGIIRTVAGDGVPGFGGDGGPASSARLNRPQSVAVAADGSVFIADRNNYRVRRIGTDGLISTVAGIGFIGYDNHHHGNGGPASQAGLIDPRVVAVGPGGRLYIGNEHVVRLVEADGIISTVAGIGGLCNFGCYSGDGGPAIAAQLQAIDDIAVGPDGSLYIAEGNQVVRAVNPAGIINTIAGSGVYGFSGDGGSATQARLHLLQGVAVGPDGSLFIADGNNRRVRRVAPGLPGLSLGDILIPSEDGGEVYVFDSQGRHLRTRHGLTGGTLFSFGYDGAGRLASVTDSAGNVSAIERDAGGRPSAFVGPFGQRTGLTTDAAGYLAAVANPAGETWRFAYAAGGLLTQLTDPAGNRWAFAYDAQGRLLQDADPAGGRIDLARTEASGVFTVALTSALAHTTSYRVESFATGAERRTRSAADGTSEIQESGADGSFRRQQANAALVAWQETPDPRWGMNAPLTAQQRVTTPGGLVYTANRERTALLANPVDPLSLLALDETLTVDGQRFTSAYDSASRLFTYRTPENRQSRESIDPAGRITRGESDGLFPTLYGYDGYGRLATVAVGEGPTARGTLLAYDAGGQLSASVDPLGRTTAFAYDGAGRVTTETLPGGRAVGYAYDANGNLASLTPPGRPAHTFAYTPLGLPARYTPPDVGGGDPATRYSYNLDRQLTRVARPDGKAIEIGYDFAGRLQSLAFSRGVVAYAYHPATGELAGILAPGGVSLTLGYDGGLLTGESWSGPVAGSVGYGYDNAFRRTAVSVNGAQTVTYAYDNDGLLTGAGGLTLTRHPQHGLLTGSGLGGIADAFGYNGFGEPVSYTASFGGANLLAFGYDYDSLGRIVTRTETFGGAPDVYVYGYDPAGRLATVRKNGAALSAYSYDANGNRLKLSGAGGPVAGSYDAQDRLQSYGSATYSYTANGELLTKTVGGQTITYAYDELGNLTGVNLPDGTQIAYVIDGLNRRVGKRVNGALTQGFLYDGQLRVVAELDGAGALISRFVYATRANVPDYFVAGGVTWRILTDHLGSPRRVVNVATGVVVQRMDYDEFGRVVSDTNPGFQPFGFAGGLYDRQTGLTRFGARDYDAISGRWTARDPLLFEGGQTNLYAYVDGEPVNRSDATGLDDVGTANFDRRQHCRNVCSVHSLQGRGGTRGCENEPTFYSGDSAAKLRCIRECEQGIRQVPKPTLSPPGWLHQIRQVIRQLLNRAGILR